MRNFDKIDDSIQGFFDNSTEGAGTDDSSNEKQICKFSKKISKD